MTAIIARISGCQNQKELSLEDQEDNGKATVAQLYDGLVEYHTIATKGKGERLDRPELELIEEAYRSKRYDFFVYDDLSRLVRGGEAVRLLGIGVDHGVRSICINDDIDTNRPTWEEDALSACSDNVAHNQRTSNRVKQKTMNRFRKFGATASRPIFGYTVPEGATTYNEWQKDLTWESYIREGKEILVRTRNGEVVADYFNRNGVPVGPYARNNRWDGVMVLRFYRNPLLKGMPQRGRMATVKHHETGKRQSKKNPKGPTYYHAPHLAFFSPEEFDEYVALLYESNANYRRKLVDGVDPRANVSRKRTRFPGQHARCWYCGRTYNWGGNGNIGHLMCSGSHVYHCWNSVHIDGAFVVASVQKAINQVLYDLDGFDDQFRSIVEDAMRGQYDEPTKQLRQIELEENQLRREESNLGASIRQCGPGPLLDKELKALEERRGALDRRRYLAEQTAKSPLQLPQSVGELRRQYEAQFEPLNRESPEFGMLLRQLVPEFHVYLVRLLDGGHLLPRARVQLTFSGIAPDVSRIASLDELLTRIVTLDLFETPEHEGIRERAVEMEAAGFQERQIARELPEKPKQAKVFKALELHRKMLSLGLTTPYEFVREPPTDYGKMRRSRNSKYRFRPLDGYVPPEI